MQQTELKIEGMSCGHCVMALKKELSKVDGVRVIKIEIGKAVIETEEILRVRPGIEKAVSEAGFALVP